MRLRLADLLTFDLDVGDGESGGKVRRSPRGTPPVFYMCGRERTCGRVKSYVWQGKELRARFAYVWQAKELTMFERLRGLAFDRR